MGKPKGAMSAENAYPLTGGFDTVNTDQSGVKQIPFENQEAIKIIEELKKVGTYKFADNNSILLEINGVLLKVYKVQP